MLRSDLSSNRAKLAELVYSLDHFSEDELRSLFQERFGERPIDGRQTVREYLRELTQLGILDYSGGIYTPVEYTFV